jgi:hypothetical protein
VSVASSEGSVQGSVLNFASAWATARRTGKVIIFTKAESAAVCEFFAAVPLGAYRPSYRNKGETMEQPKGTDYLELQASLARWTYSYAKVSALKVGDVVLMKTGDTMDRLLYRKVTAVGQGMIAFDDGRIEPTSDDLVVEVAITGPVMR